MNAKLKHPRLQTRPVCYYVPPDAPSVTNAIFLLATFLVLECGFTPEHAMSPFIQIQGCPLLEYRDATYSCQDFGLPIEVCLRGLLRGRELGWLQSVDVIHYDKFCDPREADHSIICPKLIAFRGPMDDANR